MVISMAIKSTINLDLTSDGDWEKSKPELIRAIYSAKYQQKKTLFVRTANGTEINVELPDIYEEGIQD